MKSQKSIKVIFFFFAIAACAQTTTAETEVAAKVGSLYKAMVDKDEETLKKLTLDNLTYGHSSGALEDREQFIDAVLHGPFDYISIIPQEQKIVLSGDVAVVRHIFFTQALNDGKPVEVRIGNLMIFQKHNGEWKLLARQAFKL